MSEQPQNPTKSSFADPIARLVRSTLALILREMSSRYGRSPGGYIWALLEPLGGIFVLSFAFSLLLRSPPLGTSFLLFYATGFAPFMLYQTSSVAIARSIVFSRQLLNYPSVTWFDALFARFILNCLTGFVVTGLILIIILALVGSAGTIDPEPMVKSLALAAAIGLGVGTLNCFLIGIAPVWDSIWSIATRPLFLVSGVLYIPENLPPTASAILWYNPLTHVTSLMHEAFYPTYQPQIASETYVLLFSLILFAAGLMLLRRWHQHILGRR